MAPGRSNSTVWPGVAVKSWVKATCQGMPLDVQALSLPVAHASGGLGAAGTRHELVEMRVLAWFWGSACFHEAGAGSFGPELQVSCLRRGWDGAGEACSGMIHA